MALRKGRDALEEGLEPAEAEAALMALVPVRVVEAALVAPARVQDQASAVA